MTQNEFDAFVKMPEIDFEFSHLIEWIHEIGFAASNGMGATTISYSEIYAWANLTQNTPSPFDVKVLRDMSQAFISMQEKAKDSECKDPLLELETSEEK
jgi:hypothetical protein